ncbi:hypothetical protein ACJMK2_011412 [Sinanodonta woodiana]|uniref:Uncharacterized protein n=1 Tax=Sinanodonta woodiana TaxID=1069815 RepID=A0ABD3V841_SINWO
MLTRRDFLTGSLKILRNSCGNTARINLDVPVGVTSRFYQKYARVNRKQGGTCVRKTGHQTHNKFNPTQSNSLVSYSGLLEKPQLKEHPDFQPTYDTEPQFNSKPCSELSLKSDFISLDDVVNIADDVLVEQCVQQESDVTADDITGNVKQTHNLTVFIPGNNDLEVLMTPNSNTDESVSKSDQSEETGLVVEQMSEGAKRSEELYTKSTSQTLNGESHVNTCISRSQGIRRAVRLQFQNIRLSPSNSNLELSNITSNNNIFQEGFYSDKSDYKCSGHDHVLKSSKSTKQMFPISPIHSLFTKKSEYTDLCRQEVGKLKIFKMEPISAQCDAAVSRVHQGLSRFVNKKERKDMHMSSTETCCSYIIKPNSSGTRVPNKSHTTERQNKCRCLNMSTCSSSTSEKKESMQQKVLMSLTTKPSFKQWSDCRFSK